MRDVAEKIRAEVERAAAVFRALEDAAAATPRGGGKWSRKQILGHLVDSAVNNHQRFVRAQQSSPFVWPGYDQVAWVELQAYATRPWLELVELWVALNRHVAAVVETVAPSKLATPCVIGNEEPRPLEWWMRDYVRHLRHHVKQVEEWGAAERR